MNGRHAIGVVCEVETVVGGGDGGGCGEEDVWLWGSLKVISDRRPPANVSVLFL